MQKKPFQLGALALPHNIFYAPLAGCSDFAFRQMSAKYSPAMMYCEMVKMEGLIRREPTILQMLQYNAQMRPIGGQICGSNPAIAGQAAKIIEDLGFDVVDLNCGCPVDKITKDGSGSGMLKNPERIGEVISNMVAAVKIPVTVKIRTGWDEKNINAAEVTKIAEQAGAASICIHGRTREQAYRGAANWEHIRACKEAATKIKVVGNGDLFTPQAVERIFATTGCDGVLISRGTMGNPWIVEDIHRHLLGLEPIVRDFEFRRQVLWEHFELLKACYPERRVILAMRRVGCWYFKKNGRTRDFRGLISKATDLDMISKLIQEFSPGNQCDDTEEESEAEIE